jgi:hypothetical protein
VNKLTWYFLRPEILFHFIVGTTRLGMGHSQQIAVVQMRPHEYGLTKAAYSVNETLHLLSVGRTSLYQLVKDGELVPTRRFLWRFRYAVAFSQTAS